MPTLLSKLVIRETAKTYSGRPVIITLAPAGNQSEAIIGLRLKGKRTVYTYALSDLYRNAALQHGLKESRAKKHARKMGVPWRTARKHFLAENSIPKLVSSKCHSESDLDPEPDHSSALPATGS